METLPRTFSAREVGEMLCIHPITIYRLAERGQIPSRQFGRARRFTQEDVEKILHDGWHLPEKATT